MTSLRKIQRLASRPWFAYLTLFLLQFKVVWGVWQYRDLTSGDTSSYFCTAYLWFEKMAVDIVWSPLYTAFYGSMLHIANDAYDATILHRVIIVFTVTLLVLCLMRRLLPAPIAWLVAAWWAVLPINFDCLYEVHLFAVIPVLLAWIVIGSKSSPWARGGAVAILLAATVLVRNELSVATAILAAICVAWEVWQARVGGSPVGARLRASLPGYGIPLLAALAVCGFFYERSTVKYPAIKAESRAKHTLNMAQVYAFGYQQRHPEWKKSPWTETGELMRRDFGTPLPSLGEMLKRNPRAILGNMLWNVSLIPNGLQVLLFNAASGSVNPDYAPVTLHSKLALLLSIAVGVIVIVGFGLLYRDRSYWWNSWLKDRMFYWLAMLSVAAVAAPVILAERPRPSYLFTLGIFLMALVGMCVFAMARRWPVLERFSKAMPAIMILSPILIPSYYLRAGKAPWRPMLSRYQRLAPFRDLIAAPSTKFLMRGYTLEIPAYITHDPLIAGNSSRIVDYSILAKYPKGMPLETFLGQEGINLVYVSETNWSTLEKNPSCRGLLEHPEAAGWEIYSLERTPTGQSMLLRKKFAIEDDPVLLRRLNNTHDIVPMTYTKELRKHGTLPVDGILLGQGWLDPENAGNEIFRWADQDAEIVVTMPSGNKKRLLMDVEPATHEGSLKLDVIGSGELPIATLGVNQRMTVTVDLPVTPGRGFTVHLHAEEAGQPDKDKGSPSRSFRVFGCRWE